MLRKKSAALEKLGSQLKPIYDERANVENLIKEELGQTCLKAKYPLKYRHIARIENSPKFPWL